MAVLFVRMSMGMPVIVAVAMMVVVAKGHHSDKVDNQPKAAHDKQFAQTFRLCPFPQPLECLKGNFDTQKPKTS